MALCLFKQEIRLHDVVLS